MSSAIVAGYLDVRARGIEERDGYDAARVLLPGLWRTLAPLLGSTFLVGLAHRDSLVALREDDLRTRSFVTARVEQRAREAYGLSNALFRLGQNGLRPLEA